MRSTRIGHALRKRTLADRRTPLQRFKHFATSTDKESEPTKPSSLESRLGMDKDLVKSVGILTGSQLVLNMGFSQMVRDRSSPGGECCDSGLRRCP